MGTIPRRQTADFNDEHCRQLLQQSGVALIVSHGLEEEVGMVNDTFTRLFGYTIEDIPDVAHWWPMAYPDEAYRQAVKTEWQTRVAKAIANQSAIESMEAKVRCKDDSERHIEFHFSSVGDTNLVSFVDLTERKTAEEALRKGEERLRLAAQAAKMYSFEWDVATDTVLRSPEHIGVLGVTEPLRFTHQQFVDKIHPDDRPRFIATIEGLTPEKPSGIVTYRMCSSDGSLVWLRSSGRAFFDEEGKMLRVMGMVADVTESKRAERDLALAHERLHLAIEAAGAGSWDFDVRTGRNLWFGKAHAQLGMAPDETEGSSEEFWDRVHDDDRQRVKDAMQVAKDKHTDFAEDFRVVWRNGTTRWLRSRGRFHYSKNGEPERFLGISLDVTDKKETELAIHASEELLRTFVKNVPAAVAMLDRDMRYLQVSDRWCSDNSFEASELLGRSREELPEMPERWKEFNRRALQGETLRADEDHWESGGSTRWNRWEVRPWRNPDGTVGGILIFAEDITRHKQMEEELLGMSRKLIESQEQERSRIGRELHDDINQRLAMLALELEQPPDPSEFQNCVQRFREELREISDDIQALSHDLHSTKLEYLGVVAGMKSWCKEFAERQKMDIDFKSDVRSVLPLDIGRPLFRVLQEALHNSFKHSGVKRIEVRLREDSGEIHLIISDSGRGFDVEAALQGKGLGVTSMRERVRLVNGTISIESKPMAGTTIDVRLPLSGEGDSMRVTE